MWCPQKTRGEQKDTVAVAPEHAGATEGLDLLVDEMLTNVSLGPDVEGELVH